MFASKVLYKILLRLAIDLEVLICHGLSAISIALESTGGFRIIGWLTSSAKVSMKLTRCLPTV